MKKPTGKDEDQIYVVILGLMFGLLVLGLLGPIGVLVAAVTIMIGLALGVTHAGAALMALLGAGLGIFTIDPKDWLMGPTQDMAEVYRAYLIEGGRFDTDGLLGLLRRAHHPWSGLAIFYSPWDFRRRQCACRLAALSVQSAPPDSAWRADQDKKADA